MSLLLWSAQLADSARIAEIHMASFGPNAMLRAQFPTPETREALQASIELKTSADIQDTNTTVLIVRLVDAKSEDCNPLKSSRDTEEGKTSESTAGRIIGFAKWAHAVDDEDYVEPPWIWPAGTALDVLNEWTRQTENKYNRVMAFAPCYRKLGFPSFP